MRLNYPPATTASRAAAARQSIRRSEGSVVGLAGPDADHPLNVSDENLAVTDLPGLGRLQNGLDDLVDQVGAHGHFDPRLRHEVHDVLRAAVQLCVPALAP